MSPEDKLLAGASVFDRSCRIILDGLRHENPEADECRLRELLRERLALLRRLRDHDQR
ncbi:MAG TPA: hypothetical protein VG826_22700 [Pirellulales bacterium]|nr:hypothetical protein [Pirellulales bacterium]